MPSYFWIGFGSGTTDNSGRIHGDRTLAGISMTAL